VVSLVGGALTVLLGLLAGCAFAKFRLHGRDILFFVFLSTLMRPTWVFIVPQFMTIAKLHGINTPSAVILPKAAEIYGIFLARQLLQSIPDELLDAGRLDGASEWLIFWRVVLLLSKPAIVVLSLLLALGY
jgi:ABC-type glycerol-3-phosphate transport system permease component